MTNYTKRYNRDLGIVEFIVEGHTMKQTAEEFKVSEATVNRALKFIITQGDREEHERNVRLYKKAKMQLRKKCKNSKK